MAQPPYLGVEPGAPISPKKRGIPAWLIAILVVVGFIFVLVASLFALGAYSYSKFLRAAKSAEARMMVGTIAKDAAAAYDRDMALCPSASNPVPIDINDIKGTKWTSAPSDWIVDKSSNSGFACLEFSMSDPQYYQYDYQSTGTSAPGASFTAIAKGDLDGDGVQSLFTLEGRIVAGEVITVSPTVIETHPEE